MRTVKTLALVATLAGLAACTQTQLTSAQGDLTAVNSLVTAGCSEAMQASALLAPALKGGAANSLGSVAAGVAVGCTTAQGIAKLNSDPSSPVWLGIQAGLLKAATPAIGS